MIQKIERPVDVLGEEAAEHRPAHRGGREHRADIALVAAALARGNNVGDDGLRRAPSARRRRDPEGAGQHQRGHAGRQRAGHRACDENADGREHQHAPAVDICKLAVERRHRRAGEQIGGHHPRQVADIAECRPMVGSAVATMVWSSAPRNIASMMPSTMARISGCVSARSPARTTASTALRLRLAFQLGRVGSPAFVVCGWETDFGLRWSLLGKDHGAEYQDLKAGNPLNALPVPAKQDAIARGCYVRPPPRSFPRHENRPESNPSCRETAAMTPLSRPNADASLYYALLVPLLLTAPSHAREMLPPGFVYLRDVNSSIAQDMRYATVRQFHRPPFARLCRARMRVCAARRPTRSSLCRPTSRRESGPQGL